jgi:hypothetical protein
MEEAVIFCKNKLSLNTELSLVQTEHIFDNIPFAEIATQHCDHIPPIQQILLTGKDLILKKNDLRNKFQ